MQNVDIRSTHIDTKNMQMFLARDFDILFLGPSIRVTNDFLLAAIAFCSLHALDSCTVHSDLCEIVTLQQE